MNIKSPLAIFLILLVSGSMIYASQNRISDSQKKWITVYEKQENIPDPQEMLLNKEKEPDLSSGFVDLYNGRDLDGWIPLGGDCEFEAKGDTIVGTTIPGSPSTYLSTVKDDYTNFIFTAELKWEVDSNSGFMFRAQVRDGKNGSKTVFGPQAEMEADSKDRFWSGGIYGQSCGGWYYPLWLEGHAKARNAVNYGGWNRITIKAVGTVVQTWINGVPAAHWINDDYLKGFFSLQMHSGKEGKVHFRNIKVKEL